MELARRTLRYSLLLGCIVATTLLVVPGAWAGCPVTGAWTGGPSQTYRWNLREDGAGRIDGAAAPVGGLPGDALLGISGQRSGDAVSFTFVLNGTGYPSTATMSGCDAMAAQIGNLSFAMVRVPGGYCGDGTPGSGEECDDGNFANVDGCTVACTVPACGNRLVEPGEQCDDGNLVQLDGCSNDCHVNQCGNGVVESGEQCDDGNLVNGDGCSRTCAPNACGNGSVESGEQCDDGNAIGGDACSHLCQFEGSDAGGSWQDDLTGHVWNLHEDGAGILTGNVLTAQSDPIGALTVASGNRTGNAITLVLAPGPLLFSGTLTSASTIEFPFVGGQTLHLTRLSTGHCGDGHVDAGEQCDDGNFASGDACTAACTAPRCGNQIVEPGEQCDDGNQVQNDGCSNDCHVNHCGDGNVEPGEECDDANAIDGDGCSTQCLRDVCGNGIVEPGERCDDGNAVAGDGCSPLCQFEGCPVTGAWLFSADVQSGVRLVEAADGSLTGFQGALTGAAPSLSITGSRTGSSVTLLLSNGSPAGSLTLTEPSCGHLTGTILTTVLTGTRLSTGVCGDGVKSNGEQCDDGNLAGNDACDFICRLPHCGNHALDPGETCDDGNQIDTDACRNDCSPNVCGDGVARSGIEQCDDGNAVDEDACENDCTLNVCGDGVLLTGIEACDDGNTVASDGCDTTCNVEKLAIGALPASGGSVTTDAEGDGATADDPVEATVVVPALGASSVVAIAATTPTTPTTGYQLLGKELVISAPAATASSPLRLVFDLDGAAIPAGEDETTLVVFRNGTPVPDCLGATQASPFDPCVTGRQRLAGGDVRLTVATSHASAWGVAVKLPAPTAAQAACRADIRKRIVKAFDKHRDALARCNDLVRKGKVTASCPDAATAIKIARADAQLDANALAARCPQSIVPTLGLTGPCRDAGDPVDLSACLTEAVTAAADGTIASAYAKPDVALSSAAARACQAAIAKETGKTYAVKRLGLFAACQSSLDAGTMVACLDPSSRESESRAAAKAQSGIARKCSDAILPELGQFAGACSGAAGSVSALGACEVARHGALTDGLLTLLP